MIQRLKEEAWFKPVALILSLLSVLVLWSSLAGAIFLARFDQAYTWALPLALYRYWYYYDSVAHVHLWIRLSAILSAGAVLGVAIALYSPKKRSLYGDARLANRRDMRAAGLLGGEGLLVGQVGRDYLKFSGEEHILLVAPTRERKGVAIIVPNALTWKESMVALDMKEELAELTSGWRACFQPVFIFNPVSEVYKTHRYNPLAYIPEDRNLRINEIQKIGNLFIPDRPNTDPIWTSTPRSLFLGIILMLLETPGKPGTIGQMLRETLVEGDSSKYFARTIKEREEAGNPLSIECVMALNSYISIDADVTRAGIMAGFRSRFELWMNPLVDAATSANDFDLRLVRKTPMSIYVCVTPDNLERLAPLLNLFYQQLIDLNTRELPRHNKELQYTCLLNMDEEFSIGKIPALAKGISYLAGYHLRILSVFQSTAQVVELMSRDGAKNYTANHGLQIAFAPKATETESAKEISAWLGDTTVKRKSKSKNASSQAEQRRPLMLPQEVIEMGEKWSIIVKRGMPPAKVRKIEYYTDPNFTQRLLPRTAVPVIDMEAHNQMVANAAPPPRSAVVLASHDQTVRPVVAEDIPNLLNLALGDFVVNFSKVEVPVSDTLDIEALNAYADMRCREAGINVE
jgi:type IV secretion system protein VirD4